jgi:zinc protease
MTDAPPAAPSQAPLRLDKWLWAARLFKTRALAAQAIDGGRVEVNGERAKRARHVTVGDLIRVRRGPFEYRLTIRGLSERRGPAKDAATLYEEDPMARRAREALALQLKAVPTAFYDGKGRPTKKQRRDLDRFKDTLGLLVLLALPLPGALAAQDLSHPLPTDPAVTIGTLPNGLRYYIRENHEPKQRAELRLVVHAGSVLEDDDQQGLAHFTEHMAFNGTSHFHKQAIVDYLESVGMRFGADLNAYTSFDETVYMLEIPTDTAAVFHTAFQILEDWASTVSFDSVEIDKERGVVIEEWRLGRGANGRILDKQFPILLKGSKYAERLPIGKKDILESFKHPTLVRFYKDWYRPDLMAVVAVGDFDAREVEGLIREHFSRLTNPPNERPRPVIDVPDNTAPLFAIAADPEETSTSVGVAFKQPLRDHSTYGAYRQGLVEDLFSAMLNARLYELSQKADPPFLGAGVGQGRFVGAKEFFQMGAAVKDGAIPPGLEALLTEAARVARFGFTAPELERAKARQLRSMERMFAEREKTNSNAYAGEYIRNFLEGEAFPGIATELAMTRQYLPGITLEETNRLASAWITPNNRVVMVSAPQKPDVPVPSDSDLAAVFAHVGNKPLVAYADTLSAAPLVPTAPQPGKVVGETAIPEIGVTEWTLSNGVHVVLKPTDFKDDEVLVRAISPGGTSLAPDRNWLSAEMASSVVSMSGAGAFSAVDLQKVLAGKAVSAGPMIGENEEGFYGSGSPKDLETLLQLIYLYATAPRTDSAAFAAMTARIRAFTANRGASPEANFQDTLQVTLAQGNPRERPLTAALVDSIDLGTAMAFYRDRFADLGDFTFFFVGNVDTTTLRPLVERWLGGLPSAGRKETWRDLGIRPPTGIVEKTVHKGLEPKARISIIFTGPFEDSRENRYALRSLGEALSIRLREVLREDMGGVYGVGASGSSQIVPDTSYSFSIGFGADPVRLDSLRAAVVTEIRAFQTTGPSDSIIEKVQETQRRTRETSMRQNNYWLGQLVAAREYHQDPRAILTYEQLIDALTRTTVRDAARRYLRLDNYVEVRLVPEAGKPGT